MAVAERITKIQTPSAFDYLYRPALGSVDFRVSYGGRGKGSSWNFARALLTHAMRDPKKPLRVLCAREFQSSIRESVHKLLSDQIETLGYSGFYQVQDNQITGDNGSEFIFKGLRNNITSIKSTERINVCWVEEAEAVSHKSWEDLIPTILRVPRSEIWVSFNPALATDSTYKRFVLNPPKRSIIRKQTWQDNPFLTRKLYDQQADMLIADPEAHAHVWGGEPVMRSDAQVLKDKWVVDEFTPGEDWQGPYYGGDWGFSSDPSTLVRVWTFGKRLFIEMEAGGVLMDNNALSRMYTEMQSDAYGKRQVRADPSRPETINALRMLDHNVIAAKVWPGSVEDGIAHLRSYEQIIIHPRCTLTIFEARMWRYKVDKRTEEVTTKLQPGHDHRWDAIRYALSPMIRKRMRPGILNLDDEDDGTDEQD